MSLFLKKNYIYFNSFIWLAVAVFFFVLNIHVWFYSSSIWPIYCCQKCVLHVHVGHFCFPVLILILYWFILFQLLARLKFCYGFPLNIGRNLFEPVYFRSACGSDGGNVIILSILATPVFPLISYVFNEMKF